MAEKKYLDLDGLKTYNDGLQQQLSGKLAAKVDSVPGKGLSANDFTDALKNKLEALRDAGQSQQDLAELQKKVTDLEALMEKDTNGAIDKLKEIFDFLDGISDTSTLDGIMSGKVDKVDGKGLSTNDYTDEEKQKLADLGSKALTSWQQQYLKEQEQAERESKYVASMAMTPAGTEFTGAEVNYQLKVTARYDNKAVSVAVTPTSANLSGVNFTDGAAQVAFPAPATSNGKVTVSYSANASYTDEYGSLTKPVSASQTRYAPIKILSKATTPTSADIVAATQKFVKAAVAGDYSVTLTPDVYVWICVPTFTTPTSFTSSGFSVPMEAPVDVTVKIGSTDVTYRCYRTSGAPQSSPMSLKIG